MKEIKMTIQETLKMLSNNDNFDAVIQNYQSCFDEIDSIIEELKADALADESAIASAQTKLTGLYGTIITIFKMAQAIKIQKEAQTFVRLNEEYETENPGAKPLSAAKLEKQTNIELGNYRMLRNIFEGYVMAAEKAIITCQSNIKNMKSERIFNSTNPEKY